MPISNFQELLNNALQGNDSALNEWLNYSRKKIFTQEEMNQALAVFDTPNNDKEKSFSLYFKALWHQLGVNGEVNHSAAIALYEKAIKLDNPRAMTGRADMHLQGQGGPKDYNKAIILYEKAIKLNDARAMNNRAFMHEKGLGCDKDYFKASELYDKAIKLGDHTAMYNRAIMYEDGHGGEKDYFKASQLYDEAIKLGNVLAMNNRSILYKKGLGGDKDRIKSLELFHKASELGSNTAKENINKLLEKKQRKVELYERSVNTALLWIDEALRTLKNNIGQIQRHPFPEAEKKANELLIQLEGYTQAYRKALLEEPRMAAQEAGERFNQDCQAAIAVARPILERDLDWGDYLTNLLRTLANAVLRVVTLGNVNPNSLFAYKKAALIEVVDEAEPNLNSKLT